MRYTVLLRESPDDGYVATAPAFPGCVAKGPTRAEAVAQIRQAIVKTLADVVEVTAVEVETPALSSAVNPWLETAGLFKDDPLFGDMLKEVETYRSTQDREESI